MVTRAALETPWLAPVVVAVVVAALVTGLLLRDRRGTTPVANTDDLRRVPALRAWRVRYRALRVGLALAVAAAAVAAAVLAARPVTVQERTRELANRDIVLCLDVSGSMVEYDEQVVATFERLVEGFTGERVALSVFDSTSSTVFPLTDDYTLVTTQLRIAREAFAAPTSDTAQDLFRGTAGIEGQASLIGDGVASCTLLFDQHDADRSRSVVLATDNEVWGDPVYDLPAAADLAVSRGVVVHALYPADRSLGAAAPAALRVAAEGTGGTFAAAQDPDAVPAILARVQDSQLAAMQADPEQVVTDDGDAWVWLLYGAGLAAVLLAWRVRA
ncbi:VWA domain-containing protein [Cellulomonas sp. zg-ZUI199]|uniref:VWA domain-containing protein n=1 Tax=Cellulomonas wangleii TaxID=2816956 RepID=A0ABX8D4D8_9CELL|nr:MULTISPECIES: VWA domain-containing protein [Cellulomonas]MBO0899163.1 VWA domain-containing protein [Cellulomonas sp. zg-ZUI22]MBO0923558.1 VWA domain-containing protein [Cellulomonas wangleii]QVI61891.1 VWA domain-containing protein [Cellulomonas wangleii]